MYYLLSNILFINISIIHFQFTFPLVYVVLLFFFSSRRRHTRSYGDWSSDVCSSDLAWALLHGETLPDALAARPPCLGKWFFQGGGFAAAGTGLDAELIALLDACLSENPAQRPTAAAISRRAGQLLLRGKHRAIFVIGGKTFELHQGNPRVKLQHPTLGSLTVAYDGLDFRASGVAGEIWVNNMTIAPGQPLPHCCVIAFGGTKLPASSRSFITMDVSHPEVVL